MSKKEKMLNKAILTIDSLNKQCTIELEDWLIVLNYYQSRCDEISRLITNYRLVTTFISPSLRERLQKLEIKHSYFSRKVELVEEIISQIRTSLSILTDDCDEFVNVTLEDKKKGIIL